MFNVDKMMQDAKHWEGLGREQTQAEIPRGTRIDADHNSVLAKSRTLINLKLTPSQCWERKVISYINRSVQNRKQISSLEKAHIFMTISHKEVSPKNLHN